jgi:hypothetical protein
MFGAMLLEHVKAGNWPCADKGCCATDQFDFNVRDASQAAEAEATNEAVVED